MFDPKKKEKRAELSQNFLKNPSQGKYLVELAGIGANDSILEIGPGEGALTESLLNKAQKVVAVEKDPEMVELLKQKFEPNPKLQIFEADILHFKIELSNYKVFANPPFSISSALVKRIAFIPNAPSEIYLFLQKEFANRIIAKHYNTQLAVLLKSFYSIKTIYEFKREDFSPVPNVSVVMVQFKRLDKPKINPENQKNFTKFVSYGFASQKSYLEKNYEKIFTHEQWKKLSKTLGFAPKALILELTHEQWIGLFEAFISPLVSIDKKMIVLG